MNEPQLKFESQCSIVGCDRKHHAKGYCSYHYDLKLRNPRRLKPRPFQPPKPRTPKNRKCLIVGCDRIHHANGFCQKHDRQERIKTDPEYRIYTLQKNKRWRSSSSGKAWKRRKLLAAYGITEDQYQILLKAQNNQCVVCRNQFDNRKRKPAIDHDHAIGIVRALLCSQCNTAEGLLKNPKTVLALYHYMLKTELFYYGKS